MKCGNLFALVLLAVTSLATAQEGGVWFNNPNTREQLDNSISSFFANQHAGSVTLRSVHARNENAGLLATQFKEVFDGVPQDGLQTAHGYTLYSGCQPQNCNVAGALITAPGSTLVDAAALIHWRCARTDLAKDRPQEGSEPAREGGCDDPSFPTVTIFVMNRRSANEDQIQDLKQWAKLRLNRMGGVKRVRMVIVALNK